MVTELARRAVRSEIVRADRILAGYSNEVYRVRCADEPDLIVRILRFDDDVTVAASEGEARAIDLARAAGVPAPEILLLDTIDLGGTEYPVMVQRAVAGRPLSEVIDRLSAQQLRGVLRELGGLMARLNGVRLDRELDRTAAMQTVVADRSAQRDQIVAGGISASQFDHLAELLDRYVRDDPVEQWVLCHGDLSGKHIFVTGESGSVVRISGIIDFGDWAAGAAVHDLAVFRAREPLMDPSPLLAGYGAPEDRTYRRRLDLHTLIIALDSLAFGVSEGDQDHIARSGRQVRALMRDLDATTCA